MGDDTADVFDADADIAAFLGSDDAASDPEPESTMVDAAPPEGDAAPPEGETDAPPDDDGADAPPEVDAAALTAAVNAGDTAALIKALGDKADALLGGKAHRALRLQARSIETTAAKAAKAQATNQELERALLAKYSDPVAARNASEAGDVNAFLDMVERWGGRSWNDLQRWVAKGIAGRPERIQLRAPDAPQPPAVDPMVAARAEQAQAEVAEWAKRGLVKLAPELDFPEAHDLVISEIRAGFAKGVNTPAKALPAVRAKLKARYESLHKVFGSKAPARPPQREAPAARVARTDLAGNTREATLDEEIADFLRQEGIK